MKILLNLFVLAILVNSTNLFALSSRTETGLAKDGSLSDRWVSTWTFDEKSSPKAAAGIDSDGNAWEIIFEEIFHGVPPSDSSFINAWISEFSKSSIKLEINNLPLSYRIINKQTGAWVSEEITSTFKELNLNIDISSYESGSYAIVVVYNDYPIKMLDFTI
jgi:hypothetical protein